MFDGLALQRFTSNRAVQRLAAVVSILVALAGAGVWLAQQSDGVVTGGPVVLLGIDAEDGGLNAHGPVSVYSGIITSMLGQVGNGGAGILVIGGGKFPDPNPVLQDEVTTFWQAVDANLPTTSLVYVNGAANITSASFTGFAMVAIVSSESEAPSGGLTDAENTALVGRAGDIAGFVNNGGGLIGLTQSGFTDPYLYLGNIAAVTGNTGLDFSNIFPLPAGEAIGITDALDVCCWHDDFTEYPDFLNVLAIGGEGENPVALGGSQVIITTSTTSSVAPTTVAPTTTTTTTTPTLFQTTSTTRPATTTTRPPATTSTTARATTTTIRTTSPTTIAATPARARLTG